MFGIRPRFPAAVAVTALLLSGAALAQENFNNVLDQVNRKMVKLYGRGARVANLYEYGTGIVVSPDGHVLTAASFLLDRPEDLSVHLFDGRRLDNDPNKMTTNIRVLAVEPVLDLALLKIENVKDLPYFDISAAAKRPLAQPGDWVLAFANCFKIATLDEPMTVQRGTIEAFAMLQGRRGIAEVMYRGDVYVVDAITNNPGTGGGALTNRKGELLGIVGKEIRNTLTDTWINYAIPIQAKIEVPVKDKRETISVVDFVEKAMRGEWKQVEVVKGTTGPRGVHGIRLVQDVVAKTPPFIDEVVPGSPAAAAGLRPDDLVYYVNGERVSTVKLFNEAMGKVGPGARVMVEVRRGEKLQTFELVLQEPGKTSTKK